MRTCTLVALLCALAIPLAAQPVRPVVSVRLGSIRTLNYPLADHQRAIYPEVEVGTSAYVFGADKSLSVAIGAYVGGWDDGVRAESGAEYAYVGLNAGVRLTLTPTRIPLVPVALRIGTSRRFAWGDHIGDGGNLGIGHDHTLHHNTIDLGLRLALPATSDLEVHAESLGAIPSAYSDGKGIPILWHWTLGASYALR